MCFFGKGKYVAAVACLKRAVYITPFEWIISYNLGVVHLTTGQFASAFHYFSTAINLQPSYAKAYSYLAVALSKLNDFENSCAAYEKSIELEPDYTTYLNYSVTLLANDEVERAVEQFRKYEAAIANVAHNDVDADILQQAELVRRALDEN
jgi:Bardet-Biedl syndrome 4 protein